jgi:hypothetical protein
MLKQAQLLCLPNPKFSKEVAVELQDYRMEVKHLPENGEADIWLETGRFKDNWFPSILR